MSLRWWVWRFCSDCLAVLECPLGNAVFKFLPFTCCCSLLLLPQIYELLKLNVAPSAILEMVQKMSMNSPASGTDKNARNAALPPSHSSELSSASTHKAPPTVASGNGPVQEGKQTKQHKRLSRQHRDKKWLSSIIRSARTCMLSETHTYCIYTGYCMVMEWVNERYISQRLESDNEGLLSLMTN